MKLLLRFLPATLVVAFAFLAGGCASDLSERFSPSPFVHDYEAPFSEVFPAAQRALKAMNYQVSRTSSADGLIRGHTGVRNDGTYQSATQRSVKMLVHEIATGGAHIELWISSSQEDRSKSGAVYSGETPVRDQVAYDAIFFEIERQITAAKTAATLGR